MLCLNAYSDSEKFLINWQLRIMRGGESSEGFFFILFDFVCMDFYTEVPHMFHCESSFI